MHHAQCTGPFRTAVPLILASASPRRRELLGMLGVDFSVEASRAVEPQPGTGDVPVEYARANACMKVAEVRERFPGCAILGADTIVVLEGEILGKPADAASAVEMLAALTGRRHKVITACSVVMPGSCEEMVIHATTMVWMAQQPREIVSAYVAGGEPLDKAGSYAVQGCGAFMVDRLEGSYTNVVGLPMNELVPLMLERGILSVRKN